jgi:purine-nucleoside/S-methyl-5'-thioadenosine phosphorylase / adenosine deaminase
MRPEADAIVSHASGFALSVQVADCVPILMVDRRLAVTAAVHAGWRGTCAGVSLAAVDAMTRNFGTRPADVMAAIGPSIGSCCYEVGFEVRRAFSGAFPVEQVDRWFADSGEDSIRLDLWTANRDQLISAGLGTDDIYICRLCTRTHHDLFASYRAEGERAGRMAALITVP